MCLHCPAAQGRDVHPIWDRPAPSWAVSPSVDCRQFWPQRLSRLHYCSFFFLLPLPVLHCDSSFRNCLRFQRTPVWVSGPAITLPLEWCAWSVLLYMISFPSVHISHVTITVLSHDHPPSGGRSQLSRGRSQELAFAHQVNSRMASFISAKIGQLMSVSLKPDSPGSVQDHVWVSVNAPPPPWLPWAWDSALFCF